MNYTEVIDLFKKASLYDLYRIRVAIQNEIEDPARIEAVRQCFAVGDHVFYFSRRKNSLIKALVLEKNQKNTVVEDLEDHRIWNVPYYMLTVSENESGIKAKAHQKLTKNHLKVGEHVGFDYDGKSYNGTINKLNHKTVSLTTSEGNYRVSYGMLYKILDGEQAEEQLLIRN